MPARIDEQGDSAAAGVDSFVQSRMGKRRSASRAPIILRPTCDGSTRDWANLEDGPASLVAERVLADDVVGYVRFRAVCRSWRRCCDGPGERGGGVLDDPRFRPRRWIMLLEEGEKAAAAAPRRFRRGFLNVSTGQCIQVDVPELDDHIVIWSTAADGLLFLRSEATGGVRLLNPLTRQASDLPPLTGLCKHGYNHSSSSDKAGLADDRTVWFKFFGAHTMAFAKPGDERWVLLKNVTYLPTPNVFFAGRFYGMTRDAIVTVDMNRGQEEDLPPRLVVAAKLDVQFSGLHDRTVNLIDNGGKLVVVHRTFHRDRTTGNRRMYKVYRVDLEAGKVTTRGGVGLSLGGRAVFIGLLHALSVCPQAFPSIDANTVYPGVSLSERYDQQQICAYRIRDGSTTSSGYERHKALPRPWSIADCLAVYVSAYDA